jgi:CrcB protein
MQPSLWIQVAIVAVAGAVGALARWGLASLVQSTFGPQWPWGTFAVNVLGCLLFGFVFEATRSLEQGAVIWRLMWLTGFAGAFTTFSTLAFESHQLLLADRGGFWCSLNLASHIVLGLAAITIGMALGRTL